MKTIEFNQKEAQVILASLLELKLNHKREIDRGLRNNQNVDYYQKELLIIEEVTKKVCDIFGENKWEDLW